MVFCNSPEDALEAVRGRSFDVVVSDMKMPRTNGVELVLSMRKIRDGATYLILTGAADLNVAMDAINRAEIFRFFTKPCPPPLLIEGIEVALRTRERAAAPPAGPTLVEAALDSLAAGVLVVDAEGHVLFMNRRGGELCAAGDGIVIGPDKVCRASTPAETARFHEMIRQAAGGGSGGGMSLERPVFGSPLSAVVAAADGLRDAGAVAVYLRDPDDTRIPDPGELASIFGLTPAEAQITHSLSQGFALGEAAELSGVTIGTARNYLKRVFLKTGTSRQAELVKLVLSRGSPFD